MLIDFKNKLIIFNHYLFLKNMKLLFIINILKSKYYYLKNYKYKIYY